MEAGQGQQTYLRELAREVGEKLQALGFYLVTAESCTAGMISAAITDIAGSSAWFDRGLVTYSNQAKHELLHIPFEVLQQYGAVSEEVASLMVRHSCDQSGCQVGVATTGIAGPSGGSANKPVGMVWIAWSIADEVTAECFQFPGDRDEVRQRATHAALVGLLARLK